MPDLVERQILPTGPKVLTDKRIEPVLEHAKIYDQTFGVSENILAEYPLAAAVNDELKLVSCTERELRGIVLAHGIKVERYKLDLALAAFEGRGLLTITDPAQNSQRDADSAMGEASDQVDGSDDAPEGAGASPGGRRNRKDSAWPHVDRPSASLKTHHRITIKPEFRERLRTFSELHYRAIVGKRAPSEWLRNPHIYSQLNRLVFTFYRSDLAGAWTRFLNVLCDNDSALVRELRAPEFWMGLHVLSYLNGNAPLAAFRMVANETWSATHGAAPAEFALNDLAERKMIAFDGKSYRWGDDHVAAAAQVLAREVKKRYEELKDSCRAFANPAA